MLRIPNESIVRVRDVDAAHLAPLLNLEKARERNKWSCPSCGSSDALNVYSGAGKGAYCFSCDAGFDAIDLTRAALGLGFAEAVQWLGGNFGIEIEGEAPSAIRRRPAMPPPKPETVGQFFDRMAKETALAQKRDKCRGLLRWIWEKFSLSDVAAAYLESRGIPRELAEHVGIRSATGPEWRAIHQHIESKPRGGELLKGAGLVNSRGEIHPGAWGEMLIFPYWLEEGGVDTLRFRQVGAGHKMLSLCGSECGISSPGMPYLAGHGERDAFAVYAMAKEKGALLVCEGELDALSALRCGFPAVASPGASVWHAIWCEQWSEIGKVVLLLDGDEAGQKFAKKVCETAAKALGVPWADSNIETYQFRPGSDANDELQRGTLKPWLEHIYQIEAGPGRNARNAAPPGGGARDRQEVPHV